MKRLEYAIEIEGTDLILDAIIRRFKIVFELVWKLLKDYIEHNGIEKIFGVKEK